MPDRSGSPRALATKTAWRSASISSTLVRQLPSTQPPSRIVLTSPQDSNHKHYLPTPSDDQQQQDAPACIAANAGDPSSGALMQVEDTRDRVFIHDLDAELAALESDSDRPVFLPDIEKHLLRLPATTLLGPSDEDKWARDEWQRGMQMVLYREPDTLTMAEESHSVRRLVKEVREREHTKLAVAHGQRLSSVGIEERGHGRSRGIGSLVEDPDAMDIG